jgi:hypothetical protein
MLFHYPEFETRLTDVFRGYTSNRISLPEAGRRIKDMIPSPVTEDQMDAYLEDAFSTYRGVSRLMQECLRRDILFMIDTTATRGYFQRIFAKGLLPRLPVLASSPLLSYPAKETDPDLLYDIMEIQDKPVRTEEAMRANAIPADKVILIGDSGGDGPHFEWGRSIGAFLIGSMTKPSLEAYCSERCITIDLRFGRAYRPGENRDIHSEMETDFCELIPVIEGILR